MTVSRIAAPASALAAGAAQATRPPIASSTASPGRRALDYVRVDAAHGRVLVAHGTSVTAFDLTTQAVTPKIAPGWDSHDAMPVNGEVLVTDGGRARRCSSTPRGGHRHRAGPARTSTRRAFDALRPDPDEPPGGDITLINAKSHAAVGTIVVGGDLEAAAVDGAGKAFVRTNQIAVVAGRARSPATNSPAAMRRPASATPPTTC